MKDLQSEISKILERDCGLTCPNGAENNKPSLEPLLALIKKHEREVIGEIEMEARAIDLRAYRKKPLEIWARFQGILDKKKGGKMNLMDFKANMPLKKQVELLAEYLQEEEGQKIGLNDKPDGEGAIEMAIRLLKEYKAKLKDPSGPKEEK